MGQLKVPEDFLREVYCYNAEKLSKISQNQIITARGLLEPKSLGTLHDLDI